MYETLNKLREKYPNSDFSLHFPTTAQADGSTLFFKRPPSDEFKLEGIWGVLDWTPNSNERIFRLDYIFPVNLGGIVVGNLMRRTDVEGGFNGLSVEYRNNRFSVNATRVDKIKVEDVQILTECNTDVIIFDHLDPFMLAKLKSELDFVRV